MLLSRTLTTLCGVVGIAIAARETLEEAAVHARELLAYRSDGIGTLMSVFPEDYPDDSLAGLAIGLQEYFAPYPDNGDLVLLVLPISKIYRNALDLPAQNLSITVKDEAAEREKGPLWAADRVRINLWGNLRRLDGAEEEEARKLYEGVHPDAKLWDGADGPHYCYFTRFEVYKAYYFGGFGDRKAIGWLDLNLYRSSTPTTRGSSHKTIDAVALAAEKSRSIVDTMEQRFGTWIRLPTNEDTAAREGLALQAERRRQTVFTRER